MMEDSRDTRLVRALGFTHRDWDPERDAYEQHQQRWTETALAAVDDLVKQAKSHENAAERLSDTTFRSVICVANGIMGRISPINVFVTLRINIEGSPSTRHTRQPVVKREPCIVACGNFPLPRSIDDAPR